MVNYSTKLVATTLQPSVSFQQPQPANCTGVYLLPTGELVYATDAQGQPVEHLYPGCGEFDDQVGFILLVYMNMTCLRILAGMCW